MTDEQIRRRILDLARTGREFCSYDLVEGEVTAYRVGQELKSALVAGILERTRYRRARRPGSVQAWIERGVEATATVPHYRGAKEIVQGDSDGNS